MPSPRHIVIIGAGVIGVSAAYYLARRGSHVTVVDSDHIGAGASFGNAGLITLGHLPLPRPGTMAKALKMMWSSDNPLYIAPRLDPALWGWLLRFGRACSKPALERNMQTLAQLSTATLGLFDEIHEQSKGAFYYEPRGYMEVFLTPAGLDHCQHDAEITKRYGFAYERIEKRDLLEREPGLCTDVHGAIWYPESAFCDPYKFLMATADLARAKGAKIIEGMGVEQIIKEGDRVASVTLTDGQRIEADVVVIAAGPWCGKLARQIGVWFPQQAAKGYHCDLPQPRVPLKTACILGEASMVATPLGEFMRLAGTLEFSGLNTTMRRNRLDMLTKGAARYLAGFDSSAAPRSEWVGMRPCSPDGLPIVGWAPRTRGAFIATGHAMLGLSHGPATGKIISECILDGSTKLADMATMRVDRF